MMAFKSKKATQESPFILDNTLNRYGLALQVKYFTNTLFA